MVGSERRDLARVRATGNIEPLEVDATRSVAELGRLSGRGEFAVTKDAYGLERLGSVIIRPPTRSGGTHGVLELGNRVLRKIHVEIPGGRLPGASTTVVVLRGARRQSPFEHAPGNAHRQQVVSARGLE